MSTRLETPLRPSSPYEDRDFRIGYRYVRNGGDFDMVPLTEEDFLHPQEEDRFVVTQKHVRTVGYLHYAIRYNARHGLNVEVLAEHRVDWEVEELKPHGPDVSVFRDFPKDWDPNRGTFPVVSERAKPLAVIEVTSESTRHIDFEEKYQEYEEAGIPYYVIVDLAGPADFPKLLAFRRTPQGFRPMRKDSALGYMLPDLHLWLRWENDRIVAADEEGNDIPDDMGTALLYDAEKRKTAGAEQRAEAEKQRAEAEKQRAEAEKQRAEAEKQRAEAEKQRADELLSELAALKAQLAQTKTESGS